MYEFCEVRAAGVCQALEEAGVDCMLVTPSPDFQYLTGVSLHQDERLLALVLAPGKKPFVVANQLYFPSLQGPMCQEVHTWRDQQDPYVLLKELMKEKGIQLRRAAVTDTLAAGILLSLSRMFPGCAWETASPYTIPLRMIKNNWEQEAMSQACAKASCALATVMAKGREWIGHTEQELGEALCREMRRLGIEYCSAAVSWGVSSAEPHHASTNRVIEDNGGMWIDFGALYHGYCSDITRAFYFGTPDPAFAKVHDIVNRARQAGIAAARAGAPLHAVDDAARGLIQAEGYGEYFTHRTGHGIGIWNHEKPGAGPGEITPIQPGMAFTVEPGIYLPGRFGVRVEDQLLIGPDGLPRILHDYTPELVVFSK